MADLLSKEMLFDLLINLINIAVLFIVTKKLLYKPVKKYLEERKAKIAAAQAEADRAKTDADSAKADYESRIAAIEAESEKIRERAAKAAKAESDRITAEAREKAAEIIGGAESEAERKKQAAVDGAKQEIGEIAIEMAGKLIGRNVDDADNRRIVEEFFRESEDSAK